MLWLAAAGAEEAVDESLSWLRQWARRFFNRLCQVRDPAAAVPPSLDQCAAFLRTAPPFLGAEYASPQGLAVLWSAMQQTVAAQAAAAGGLEAWLKAFAPAWEQIGRVTLHLAENPRDQAKPFAFLATWTDRLAASGKPAHVPLGRALQAAAMDPGATAARLGPVRAAAAESGLLRELLETKDLFKPLAWTPAEAWRLVKDIPALEAAGLVVKVPDWWQGGRPPRPRVQVTLEAPQPSALGLQAMLGFSVRASLDGQTLTEAEWQRILSGPKGLVSLKGRWMEVDPGRLAEIMAHWRRVQSYHEASGLPFLAGMRLLAGGSPAAGTADDLAAALGADRDWLDVQAGDALRQLLEKNRATTLPDPIPGLNATLRPYQRDGTAWIDFLTRLGLGACLADDMGLGKTLQVIAVLCVRKARGDSGPALIIMPASLLGNWRDEFARFAPGLRIFTAHASQADSATLRRLPTLLDRLDVVLTTYGMATRLESLAAKDWPLLILDEAQAIKTPGSGQTLAIKRLTSRARLALTGTPVENRPSDLWSLSDFLNPGLLGSAGEFALTTDRLASAPVPDYSPLRKLIAPWILRRLKTDRTVITDLPEKIELTAHCPLSRKQVILYGKLVENLKLELKQPTLDPFRRASLVLTHLAHLKQVCNHPSLWSGDGLFLPADSGKFTRLAELAAQISARQERCLVFTQFREMTDVLLEFLAPHFGRPGLVLHGGTPVARRPDLVARFQSPDGPPFFVISLKAGGTGLNLTAASHVIHFDRWWNPAVESQATDRAFRIGQQRNVLVHKFICPGTLEERIDRLLETKKSLAQSLLSPDPEGAKMLTDLTDDELLETLQLDLGRVGG